MVTKIMVKTVLPNGKERYVELDRGALSLEYLKSELQRKTGQKGQWHIRVGNKSIQNDADLLAIVIEVEKAKESYLIVDIIGGQPQGGRPATAARPSTTQAQARPSSSSPVSTPVVQPRHAPPPPVQPVQGQDGGSGVFTVFSVRGDFNGLDKPRVNAKPEGRSYVFRVQPSKTDTTIEVTVLAAQKQLQFKLTHAAGTFVQSFNMPFDIKMSDLSLVGEEVILTIPQF